MIYQNNPDLKLLNFILCTLLDAVNIEVLFIILEAGFGHEKMSHSCKL